MQTAVLRILTSGEELRLVRREWTDLWLRNASSTPFQSPWWLLPWWDHLGRGQLFTPVLRSTESGELLGLFPFYIYREPGNGRRKLFPLGISTSDYLDLLYAPGAGESQTGEFMEFLRTTRGSWDECSIPQLAMDSPLLKFPRSRIPEAVLVPAEPCPSLELPAQVSEFRKRLPPGTAQNLRTAENRAAREGRVEFEEADSTNSEELFDTLVRLHSARREQLGEPGIFSLSGVADTHREVLSGFLEAGILRLYALRLNGGLIAVFYGFTDRSGSRLMYYLGGFDPAFSFCSPGNLLVAYASERHIEQGGRVLDFLRGQEAYKYSWGAVDRPTYRLSIREGSAHGMV